MAGTSLLWDGQYRKPGLKGAKVLKCINNPTWLLGPKRLSLPSEFWSRYKDKEVIDENEVEYKRKPDDLIAVRVYRQRT